jgi:16S rRNA (cytidine1402-2'-O)-methyltransferase
MGCATTDFTNFGDPAATGLVLSGLGDQQLYFEPEISSEHCFEDIVGKSAALRKVLEQVAIVGDAQSGDVHRIVRAALEAGIRVVPIPGSCAFVTALSVCGRPTDLFTFLGFLPSKKGARRMLLESLKAESRTLVFYEAPGRLVESLRDVEEILGTRPVTIAREMTKVYEELFFGNAVEATQHYSLKPVKGEVVLIIEKAPASSVPLSLFGEEELRARLDELVQAGSLSKSDAIRQLAQQLGTSRRELYQLLLSSSRARQGRHDE